VNFSTRAAFISLIFSLTLAACAPASSSPSLDPAAQIATVAAATIAALPTNTPYPTRTATRASQSVVQETMSVPSATPIPSLTPFPSDTPWATLPAPGETTGGIPILGGAPILYTATPEKWRCEMRHLSPADGSYFKPRTGFRAEWRIFNTGGKTWKVGEVRIKYMGGTPMQNSPDFVNDMPLPISIYPQEKLLVHISMTTPKEPGNYTSFWALVEGKKNVICNFYISVNVR